MNDEDTSDSKKQRRAHILLVDSEIARLARDNNLIDPFEVNQLSGCTYDLRAGSELKSRNRHARFDLTGDGYEIESGECVTVDTLETINFRKTLLFGIVANKHTIAGKGLFHPITTIDPGFIGPLALTFFNLGGARFKIKRGDSIAKVILWSLVESPQRIYGLTQNATHREGSTDFALVMDEPKHRNDDDELAKMYGEPIRRLYDHWKKLDLLEAQRQLRGYRWVRDVIFALLIALVSAFAGAWLTIQLTPPPPQGSTGAPVHPSGP